MEYLCDLMTCGNQAVIRCRGAVYKDTTVMSTGLVEDRH